MNLTCSGLGESLFAETVELTAELSHLLFAVCVHSPRLLLHSYSLCC